MEKFWLKSYEPEVPHSIDYPKVSLYEMLKQTAERFPANDAVSFMGRALTYQELLSQVDAFAAA